MVSKKCFCTSWPRRALVQVSVLSIYATFTLCVLEVTLVINFVDVTLARLLIFGKKKKVICVGVDMGYADIEKSREGKIYRLRSNTMIFMMCDIYIEYDGSQKA